MPQQLDLTWVLYDKNSNHYLLLYLGEAEGYTIAIDARRATPRDTMIIRANLNHLRRTNLETVLEWVKKELPDLYNNAVKKFKTNQLIIKKEYSLSQIDSIKKTSK